MKLAKEGLILAFGGFLIYQADNESFDIHILSADVVSVCIEAGFVLRSGNCALQR